MLGTLSSKSPQHDKVNVWLSLTVSIQLARFVILAVFGGVIGIVGLFRLLSFIGSKVFSTRKARTYRVVNWYRNHILEAPLLRQTRAQAHEWFHGSLIVRAPGRIHTLALVALLVTNLVCSFAFYESVPPDSPGATKILGTKWHHYIRAFSDRTAMLAMAQLTLTFAFSGRNSPVVLITGCNFNTLMLYHRWLARIVTATTLGHAVGYTILFVVSKSLKYRFTRPYWNWGIASLAMWFAACFFGYTAFRRWSYEIFLLTHIIFVVWSIVALWKHIMILEGAINPFMVYLWVAIGFWCFDRLLRTIRVIVMSFNITALVWGSGKPATTQTILRTLPDGNLVLRVRPAGYCSGLLHVQPGQHVYINIPYIQPMTLHPFTVITTGADAEDGSAQWIDLGIQPVNGFSRLLAEKHVNKDEPMQLTTFVEGPYGRSVSSKGYDTCFLVAAGIGVTHTLGVLLDACKTARLVALNKSPDEESGVMTKQRVDFVWAVRSAKSLPLALPYLVSAAKQMKESGASCSIEVSVRVFITGQATNPAVVATQEVDPDVPQLSKVPGEDALIEGLPRVDSDKVLAPAMPESDDAPKFGYSPTESMCDSKTWNESEKQIGAPFTGKNARLERNLDQIMRDDDSSSDFVGDLNAIRQSMKVSFHLGRPVVLDELTMALNSSPSLKQSKGNVLVTSCGPAQFSDAVRQSIRLSRSNTVGIDFDEEVFAW